MKGKKISKVINNIATALLFTVLFMALFFVISMKASGGEASVFGYQFKSVLSGSMEPDIQTGAFIAVKETDENHAFAKGDVITFMTEEDMVVTHRIDQVEEEGQTYITKGDANDAADNELVKQENIIGKYNGFTVPYIGYVMTFLGSSEGAAMLMVLPGVGLLIYSTVLFAGAFRKMDRSRNEAEPE